MLLERRCLWWLADELAAPFWSNVRTCCGNSGLSDCDPDMDDEEDDDVAVAAVCGLSTDRRKAMEQSTASRETAPMATCFCGRFMLPMILALRYDNGVKGRFRSGRVTSCEVKYLVALDLHCMVLWLRCGRRSNNT